MEQPSLDWGAAEVHDGTLSVRVSEDPDEHWAQTFARTLVLLASDSDWGPATYDEQAGAVTVENVSEGSEDRVRFALDGAVQEANAHHAADADAPGADADGGQADDDDDGDDGDQGDDPDVRMTDRFRDA